MADDDNVTLLGGVTFVVDPTRPRTHTPQWILLLLLLLLLLSLELVKNTIVIQHSKIK